MNLGCPKFTDLLNIHCILNTTHAFNKNKNWKSLVNMSLTQKLTLTVWMT